MLMDITDIGVGAMGAQVALGPRELRGGADHFDVC